MAAKKKLPTKINILGKEFSVEYTGDIDTDTYGETRVVERQIKINIHKENQESTLLHEIIHAIIGVSGVSERLRDGEEEALVVLLENGLQDLVEIKK